MVPFKFNAFYDNDHESKRVLTMENFATLFCLYTVKLHKVNSIGNIDQGKSAEADNTYRDLVYLGYH